MLAGVGLCRKRADRESMTSNVSHTSHRTCGVHRARIVQISIAFSLSCAVNAFGGVSDGERARVNRDARPGSAAVSDANREENTRLRAGERCKTDQEQSLLRAGLAAALARSDIENARQFERALGDAAGTHTTPHGPLAPNADSVNLTLYVTPGWSKDVVVRSDTLPPNVAVLVPDTLASGSLTTYFNIGGTNVGNLATPNGFTDSLLVDGIYMQTTAWPAWSAGNVGLLRNQGPYSVRGGRHTVSVVRDAKKDVAESNETDNRTDVQYVWAPTQLAPKTPTLRPHPPARGFQAFPNCDGFQILAGWWAVVATAPTTSGDDVDVALCTDYSGATDGFSNIATISQTSAGLTDITFVNGNEGGYGIISYPAVTTAPASGPAYYVESVSADTTFTAGHFGPYSFGANALVRFYELDLAAGSWAVRVDNKGATNLDIALVGPGQIYWKKIDALGLSTVGAAGADESLYVTVPTRAFYGLAVFKHGAADVPNTALYDIYLDMTAPVVTSLIASPPSWSKTNAFSFTWAATDPETGVRYSAYKTTGSDTKTTAFTVSNITAAAEGVNTFSVKCANAASGVSGYTNVSYYFDPTAPSSSVTSLPPEAMWSNPLTVNWNGTDAASGVLSYDVQYKLLPSGTWTDWRTSTPAKSAPFGPTSPVVLVDGDAYAFRSRARDVAGNVEAWPTSDSLGDGAVLFTTVSAPPDERQPDPVVDAPSFALAAPWPSPARSSVTVDYSLDRSSFVSVDVLDAAGRVVRSLVRNPRAEAGAARVRWDLRDAGGRDVPAGVYTVRVSAADARRVTARAVVVR